MPPSPRTSAPGAVDALEALRLADEGAALLAAGDAAAAADTCRAGIALFGTEVLPAAGDAEWARAHRVRLEEARLRLTEDELAARMQLGASGEVTGVLEALVAAHPLRERLWALLVTALYRAGRQSDALAAHRRVARLLAEELGVDPSPELAALERQVLTHDRALAPVARPAPKSRAGLRPPRVAPREPPRTHAPLVGRTGEVAALVTALDAHRLVTVTGPAGVGKTRLAVEVARQVDAAHGTWLVRLDAARHPDDIAAVVADAVPFVDGPDARRGAARCRGAARPRQLRAHRRRCRCAGHARARRRAARPRARHEPAAPRAGRRGRAPPRAPRRTRRRRAVHPARGGPGRRHAGHR